MTLDEAKKVAAICSTADGGCGYCVNELQEELQAVFPEFNWTYTEKDETSFYNPKITVTLPS